MLVEVVFELYPRRSNAEIDVARLGMRVASISEVTRRLTALGAEVQSTVAIDPDGRRVELVE